MAIAAAKHVTTPWGTADRFEVVASGVTWYTTPSHGGFHVTKEAAKRIHPAFLKGLWAGEDWYEEDIDAYIVLYYWPEARHNVTQNDIEKALQAWKPEQWAASQAA